MTFLAGYEEALEYAENMIRDCLAHISNSEIKEMEFPDFYIDFHPEIKANGQLVHTTYEVSDKLSNALSVLAMRDPEFFEVATRLCGANILNGVEIPTGLRSFAFQRMLGIQSAPSRPGRKTNGFVVRHLMYQLAVDIADNSPLELTRGIGKGPDTCACDVVLVASAKNGQHVAYNTIRDWCNSSKYRRFRDRSSYINDLMKDTYLIGIGAMRGVMHRCKDNFPI